MGMAKNYGPFTAYNKHNVELKGYIVHALRQTHSVHPDEARDVQEVGVDEARSMLELPEMRSLYNQAYGSLKALEDK